MRSQGTTGRTWLNPEGRSYYKSVALANVFVMRMLYVHLRCNGDCVPARVRLYFAHQRGVHFVVEQPVSSVTASDTVSVLFETRSCSSGSQCRSSCCGQTRGLLAAHICQLLVRRVSFPMGSYGSPTLKFTQLLGGKVHGNV